MLKVVLLEDDVTLNKLIKRSLGEYFSITSFFDFKSAYEYLKYANVDVVISDIKLPDGNGIELLKKIKVIKPEVYFILITGYGTVAEAVNCIKSGAYDYILKPVDPDLLKGKLDMIEENLTLKLLAKEQMQEGFIYNSKKMVELVELALKVAKTDTNVLITGETGTGKGVLSKYIHIYSDRKNAPFIKLNCANLQETLFESEIFGYKKGAFTGASTDKKGLATLADKGTLFLDEISEVPLSFQAKLLRFIEEKTFMPLGGSKEEYADVRIVAATNKDLANLVERKEFREDLYFRLNVINLKIPPLRERREDIIPLAYYFLEKFRYINSKIKGISSEVKEILLKYDFPGNIRELSNIIERAMIIENGEEIRVSSISLCNFKSFGNCLSLAEMEKRHILYILDITGGDKSKTAKLLDIDRSTLYRKLKDYNVL